ncbi:DUF2786 domain-containing protein [Pseudomonas segetis]|uniref:Uncharacterized protein n=1 Tax=Pseudomonas segetis TaxID=298908 RepID=A0A239JN49_9PSED|nr:DUF2786 domain-containing protein [Pseudomonas segetis]SNT07235.1 Protein of unknown function [Pseudomonas segetis]
MDHKKALEKIKKCLRMAASSNPHEAAAAMRQARALMEKFQLEEDDVLASEVQECATRSGAKNRPVAWEVKLAAIVSRAYSCSFLFMAGVGEYRFIGEMAEVASYTMTLLLRQVRQARRDYIAANLTRCKAATKTKRADVFCDAWAYTVHKKVIEFAGGEPSAAVNAYIAKNHPELETGKATERNSSKGLTQRNVKDAMHGIAAASDVRLNHGVKGEETLALH